MLFKVHESKREKEITLNLPGFVAKYTALFPWRSARSVHAWLSAGAAPVKGAPQRIIR